ncbi:DUF4209 domain-containing protein [Pedobacter sp. AW31-3R]|uniref:DUF4209 domain-containing protein n=1 Tax=Pedobacter sp. AW31-3R TaxID=3445781 RepID=UPI003F9F35F2
MHIQQILQKYDDPSRKDFEEYQLNSELNKNYTKVNGVLPVNDLAELMAFGFYEDYQDRKTGWGTYFGPMTVIPNDNGTVTESPSIRLVNTEILNYWYTRAKIAKHPILIARYSGLVWDFTKYVTQNQPAPEIARVYINAIITVALENYYINEINVFSKLKSALSIAILLSDKELISNCKNTIITFENTISKDLLPGIWGHAFDLLMFNKKAQLSEDEEKLIIDELEAKLERLLSNDVHELKNTIWPAQNSATRLADYYRKRSQKEDVFRVICKFADASEQSVKGASVAEIAGNAQDLYKLYTKYHLKDKAAEMLLKVRSFGNKVPSEMKTIGTDLNIPTEKIKEYLDGMTKGGLADTIQRLLFTYVPIKKTEEGILRKKAANAPISYIFTQQLIDSRGRPIITIGPLEEDFDGHLIKEISNNLTIQSITLRFLIDEMISKFGFNSSDILEKLKDCPVIDQHRLKIIEKGLDAYFENDFVVAIHLIIPQIEEAIRNIVEFGGGNVLKESRGGGFHLRTFDDILRDNIISESLDADLVNYFKILFTDQRGWNLRNNVCHGMTNLEDFNFQTADRLIHTLLCLSLIKHIE